MTLLTLLQIYSQVDMTGTKRSLWDLGGFLDSNKARSELTKDMSPGSVHRIEYDVDQFEIKLLKLSRNF